MMGKGKTLRVARKRYLCSRIVKHRHMGSENRGGWGEFRDIRNKGSNSYCFL